MCKPFEDALPQPTFGDLAARLTCPLKEERQLNVDWSDMAEPAEQLDADWTCDRSAFPTLVPRQG